MNNKKLKKLSLANLFTGYLMMLMFILLVFLNRSTEHVVAANTIENEENLFHEVYKDTEEPEKEIVYVDRHVNTIRDYSVGPDRLDGIGLDDDPDVIVLACSQYGQRQLLKDLLDKINGGPHDNNFITLFDGYADKPASAPTSDIGATGLTIVAAQVAAD